MRAGFLIVIVLTACWGGADREPVIVGAKSGAESEKFAELVVTALERAGCRVERRYGLGGPVESDAALTAGRIDAYVESQRIALLEVLQEPEQESMRIENIVRPAYVNRDLYWSPPIGSGDLAAVFRRDIDQKCRAASRALMRVAYAAE